MDDHSKVRGFAHFFQVRQGRADEITVVSVDSVRSQRSPVRTLSSAQGSSQSQRRSHGRRQRQMDADAELASRIASGPAALVSPPAVSPKDTHTPSLRSLLPLAHSPQHVTSPTNREAPADTGSGDEYPSAVAELSAFAAEQSGMGRPGSSKLAT